MLAQELSPHAACWLPKKTLGQCQQETLSLSDCAKGFEEILGEAWQSAICIVGYNSDPFAAGENRFDIGLKLLELIAPNRPALLCIQTRSPLITLATPLLRGMQDSVAISVAFETERDSIARRSTPELPRPSERLTLLKTLDSLGFYTVTQLKPLSPKGFSLKFVQDVASVSSAVCLNSRYAQHLPQGQLAPIEAYHQLLIELEAPEAEAA